MKKFIIILGAVLLFILILFICFIHNLPDYRPTYVSKSISFQRPYSTLYLKSKYWGISADHSFTVLSTTSINEDKPDNKSEFIYHNPTLMFYRTSRDSLWLYVYSKSPIPVRFKSNIKIIQVELENPGMMKIKKTGVYNGKVVSEYK